MDNTNDNTQPNQPSQPDGDARSSGGDAGRAPRKRSVPQQVPPLPRSRFTRFLVDYVGAGHYQLSAQGKREVPLPLAKGGDPTALVAIAMRTAEAGDEIVVAPLVALVHVVTQISTEQFASMHGRGEDPFAVIGIAFTMDGNGEPAPQPEGPARMPRSNSPMRRISGVHESKLSPEVRDLLDRDNKSGGRIGWVFRQDSSEGETPPPEMN